MSDQTNGNRATILFDAPVGLDFVELVNELQRPFRNIALEFEQTAVAEGSHALFISDSMIVRVGYAPQTDWARQLQGCERPSQPKVSTALVDALLEEVHQALEVTVEGGPGRAMPERTRLAACYHVVRHLLRRHDASLVHWSLSDTLFTAEEFENPTAMAAPGLPRRPERRERRRTTPRPKMDLAMIANAAPGTHPEAAAFQPQPDAAFADGMQARDATAQDDTPAHASVHDMSLEEERLRRNRKTIFTDGEPATKASRRPPPRDEIGLLEQLTTYVMTITIMVLSFPVGVAMLIYTVLRGENLNMTARAMSLTAVGVGLASSPVSDMLTAMI
ncbi:hypothetical protein [Actibacterium sp. D379-3]